MSWNTASTAVLAEGQRLLIADPHRFDGLTAIGVDDAAPVMVPFHIVRIAADALDECRGGVQQRICGRRARTGDPLRGARRTLHTPVPTCSPASRPNDCQGPVRHGVPHRGRGDLGIYQRMINAQP